MATAAGTSVLSMKLLIDRKAQRVLFAEASKEVVDFLFSLLALPVATAVKLVGKNAMVGCVGNLYASVEKLDSTYVQAGAAKDALLCPTVVSPAPSANSSILGLPAPSGQPTTFYRCTTTSYGTCRTYITSVSGTACPHCSCKMTTAAHNVVPAASSCSGSGGQVVHSAGKGFVQGIVTYTVLDNLTISPMSAISSIALLNTFAVRDIRDLQEKNVQLGYKEGLAILKASLQSQSVQGCLQRLERPKPHFVCDWVSTGMKGQVPKLAISNGLPNPTSRRSPPSTPASARLHRARTAIVPASLPSLRRASTKPARPSPPRLGRASVEPAPHRRARATRSRHRAR